MATEQKITQADVVNARRRFATSGGLIQRMVDQPQPLRSLKVSFGSGSAWSSDEGSIPDTMERASDINKTYAIPTPDGIVYARIMSEAVSLADLWGVKIEDIRTIETRASREPPLKIRDEKITQKIMAHLANNGPAKKRDIEAALKLGKGQQSLGWISKMGWIASAGGVPANWFLTTAGHIELERRVSGKPPTDIPPLPLAVYHALAKHDDASIRLLASIAGGSLGRVYHHVIMLMVNGYVRRIEKTRYTITDKQPGTAPWITEIEVQRAKWESNQ